MFGEMSDATERFCVNCLYCFSSGHRYAPSYQCRFGKGPDLVTGKPVGVPCHEVRMNETLCGQEGNWWEKNNEP